MTELTDRLTALPADVWQDSEVGGGQRQWLPLFSLSTSGIWLGLDLGGAWVLGRPHGRAATSAAYPTQSWLLMLDFSESDFKTKLISAAEIYGIPGEALVARLPVDDVLAVALSSQSSHWTERALEWLRNRTLREDHVELIRRIADATWATQRARQIARRISRSTS